MRIDAQIEEIMLAKGKLFRKHRYVWYAVSRELNDRGRFLRTQEGRLFYFDDKKRRLYDIAHLDFTHFVAGFTGLAPTETVFKFVLAKTVVETSRRADLAEVYTIGYYSVETGRHYVSDGGNGIWMRDLGGDWEHAPNGEDGVLFLSDPTAESWKPEFGNGAELSGFLHGLRLADSSDLSSPAQRALLKAWIAHQYFPSLRQTRMIPAFLGPKGSGKTSAARKLGRLMLGPAFEVTPVLANREDAFVAAVTHQTVCALDNADSRVAWLPDALATYATGARYSMRSLYTTNELVSYPARAVLMLTSRDPQFNRPDVTDRLLPLYFKLGDEYLPEAVIYEELAERRPRIPGDLLALFGGIADCLASDDSQIQVPQRLRMADFAAFGELVVGEAGRSEWRRTVLRLERSQAAFAAEGDDLAS